MHLSSNNFLLLGAGDLAREVAQIIRDRTQTLGYTDNIAVYCDIPNAVSRDFDQVAHSVDEALSCYPPTIWSAVCCVGAPMVRQFLYDRFIGMGYSFGTICSPDATNLAASIGDGSIIFSGARLAIGAVIGVNVVINYNSVVGHDATLGDHSVLSPGVMLGGRIKGGTRVFYGLGASVLQKLSIGDGAVIAAGSSVWMNIEDSVTAMGVPAMPRKIPGRK